MDRFIRQQDIRPADKLSGLKVTVIGCGAVGSFTCLTAKATIYCAAGLAAYIGAMVGA